MTKTLLARRNLLHARLKTFRLQAKRIAAAHRRLNRERQTLERRLTMFLSTHDRAGVITDAMDDAAEDTLELLREVVDETV